MMLRADQHRQQRLVSIEQFFQKTLETLQRLKESCQKQNAPFHSLSCNAPHQQRLRFCRQYRYEKHMAAKIWNLHRNIKRVLESIAPVDDYLETPRPTFPNKTHFPTCELKRCAVYSRFWETQIPVSVWLLVADYAEHHQEHSRVFEVPIHNPPDAGSNCMLQVHLFCWCVSLPANDFQSPSDIVLRCHTRCNQWENRINTSYSLASSQCVRKHDHCVLELQTPGPYSRPWSHPVECDLSVFDLLSDHQAWNRDQDWPHIHDVVDSDSVTPM